MQLVNMVVSLQVKRISVFCIKLSFQLFVMEASPCSVLLFSWGLTSGHSHTPSWRAATSGTDFCGTYHFLAEFLSSLLCQATRGSCFDAWRIGRKILNQQSFWLFYMVCIHVVWISASQQFVWKLEVGRKSRGDCGIERKNAEQNLSLQDGWIQSVFFLFLYNRKWIPDSKLCIPGISLR